MVHVRLGSGLEHAGAVDWGDASRHKDLESQVDDQQTVY
jgi:hypothetical protein